MSTYFDMLFGAAEGPINDTVTLLETRPYHRGAAIMTGVTFGLMAIANPAPFVVHSVINLTANAVRAAERNARLDESGDAAHAYNGGNA